MSNDAPIPADVSQPARRHYEAGAIVLLFVYFAARLFYFASVVDPSIPPDETTHFGIARLHAQTWGLRDDSPESYPFGLLAHTPRLYYYLMGRCLNMNVFGLDDLFFLRLCNIPLGLLCVWFGYLWMRIFAESSLVRVVFVAVITNTLMFSFLFGSVSYDNLTNCLAAGSVYLCFRFMDRRDFTSLAAFVLVLALGGLTKTTFLPLACVLCLILVVNERQTILGLFGRKTPVSESTAAAVQPRRTWNWGSVVLCCMAAVFVSLNVWLYGTNLLRYRALTPRMNQVLTLDQCLQNRIFARDYIVSEFRRGVLSLEDADAMVENTIQKSTDRTGTHTMLRVTRQFLMGTRPPMTLHAYIVHWHMSITRGIYGVAGHRNLLPSDERRRTFYLFPLAAAIIFVGICLFPRWRAVGRPGRTVFLFYSLAIVAFYAAVLFTFNYRQHVATAHPSIGLQGRYIFPVLVPYYGLLAQLLIDYLPRRVQTVAAFGVCAFFIFNDFPFFLYSPGSDVFH